MNIEINISPQISMDTWIFWLVVILFTTLLVGISWKKFPPIEIRKCVEGIWEYYKEKFMRYAQHHRERTLSVSAKFVKELAWLIIVCAISFITIGFIYDIGHVHDLIETLISEIKNGFTLKYPLLTTIIGAYLALIFHYLFVHSKIYVCPDAYVYADREGISRLGWYIENRSLFDCIDIHVDAFACVYTHAEDDLQTYRIHLKRSDYSVLSGRLAASNDRSIGVTTFHLPKEVYHEGKYNFDYLELSVKVTHSLSHVSKVITKQYQKEDIYKGEMHGGKRACLRAFENPQITIKTIKAAMLQRFMYARKFESISLTAIIVLLLITFIWPNLNVATLGLINVGIVSFSLILVIMGLMRFFYQFPVHTFKNDENEQYRANIDQEFPQGEAQPHPDCPYIA